VVNKPNFTADEKLNWRFWNLEAGLVAEWQ
jgi:hypothetical protein